MQEVVPGPADTDTVLGVQSGPMPLFQREPSNLLSSLSKGRWESGETKYLPLSTTDGTGGTQGPHPNLTTRHPSYRGP